MNFLPCLGGTNDTHHHTPGATHCTTFRRDEKGDTVYPMEAERYVLDRHPELGEYWRLDTLVDPDQIAAALATYRDRIAARSDAGPLGQFRRATVEREFEEWIRPINAAAVMAMLPVLRRETADARWRPYSRGSWGEVFALLREHPNPKLQRAETVKVEDGEVVVWFDPTAYDREPGGCHVDHAVMIEYRRRSGGGYWADPARASALLLQPPADC